MSLKLHIVLFEPEIPQNTGNIARTCACIGATLHLVEPLGFRPSERNLKRAGLDYWDDVKIIHHASTKAFLDEHSADNLYFFTGQAERSYAEVDYAGEVFLVFGRESRGIDPEILERYAAQCVRIPMKEGLRSLNLSNAAAIGAYEALRQNGFSRVKAEVVMDYQVVYIVCSILAFIPAIVCHEFMHGFAAYKLGDNTAKQSGRLTLNPLKHIDPFGTIILPLLLAFMHAPVFGYAKPVPYNPNNFKDKRVGDVVVGLAGPAANLVLALIGSALMFALHAQALTTHQEFFFYFYWWFLPIFIMVNLYLMFFNLLPIPPLDGSSIIAFFLPVKYLPTYYKVQQYAFPIFLIVLFVLPYLLHFNIISEYLNVTAGALGSLLIPGA